MPSGPICILVSMLGSPATKWMIRVKPKHCMFVGDGGSDELAGARSAGMDAYQAVWYVPDFIRSKISGFPRLMKPNELFQ